jgi:hypothetical protein
MYLLVPSIRYYQRITIGHRDWVEGSLQERRRVVPETLHKVAGANPTRSIGLRNKVLQYIIGPYANKYALPTVLYSIAATSNLKLTTTTT